jgi:hypothetical protein
MTVRITLGLIFVAMGIATWGALGVEDLAIVPSVLGQSSAASRGELCNDARIRFDRAQEALLNPGAATDFAIAQANQSRPIDRAAREKALDDMSDYCSQPPPQDEPMPSDALNETVPTNSQDQSIPGDSN